MNNQDIISTVKRDYTKKIQGRYDINSSDINEFISLMNYCFLMKNNFFVENFNKKTTKNIYLCYNQMKTNILNPNNNDLFENVTKESLKSVKFVLTNFISKFEKITNENENVLTQFCSKNGIRKFLDSINTKI